MAHVSLKLLVLKTDDVCCLRQFYELLGIKFAEEQHGSGPVHFAGPIGDAIFELYPLGDNRPVDDTTRLGFVVEDPDAVISIVESAGGRIVKAARETAWGYMAVVADPDGRSVELYRA